MSQYVLRLEVVSGPLKGQAIVLRDQDTVVVGRLPTCGLAIPQDLSVSRQHFQIKFCSPIASLTHLSQTGDTLVNGRAISHVELRQGDEIAFGDGNKIQVAIETNRGGGGVTPTAIPIPKDPGQSDSANQFTMTVSSCGWNLFESVSPQLDFTKVLEILVGSQPVSCVMDFRRLGVPLPTELSEPRYLYSWIQPPVRDQFSPVLASVSDNPVVADIIRAGWGKDAIVTFGSNLKDDDLVAHWRKAIGTNGDQPGTSMTAYYWPSILGLILTCQSSDQVDPLLNQLTWIFVEDKKSPGKWRLFTKADFSPNLTKCGLVASERITKPT